MGILIFEGMKVGVQDGDFTITVDERGSLDSRLILSTSYNVLPLWLKVAQENLQLSRKASKEISEQWCDDVAIQKKLLLAELTPSVQVVVACGIALDTFYAQLKDYCCITDADIETWKRNKTSRAAQITEVIRRVCNLNKDMTIAFKTNIKSIMDFRDQAVHPTHSVKRTCKRLDVPVRVDWRFAAYTYSNSIICYGRTMEMIIYVYEKEFKDARLKKHMGGIIKVLKELELIREIN